MEPMPDYEYAGPPLDKARVRELVDQHGINAVWYSLDGAQVFDGFVLRHTPEGFVVFYTERGTDRLRVIHRTESEPCRDLLERVLNDRGLNRRHQEGR